MKELNKHGPKTVVMLPVGTLIHDKATGSGGIIVGAFKGASYALHTYIRPDGEVDVLFPSDIEIVEGNGCGIPAVVDLNGNDPLASMRGGKPITGKALARRVAHSRRRASVAAAA